MKETIRLFTTMMVCTAMVLCVSCKKDDDKSNGGETQTVATVTTEEVTDIMRTCAVCGGEVESENGWAVTEHGVCWSEKPNPTLSDNRVVDGEGVGAFISKITCLEPGTKYYVRAYAKNAAGTGFGAERSFTTLGNSGGGGMGDHAYVDLGLPSGLLWATCNVGADSPGDYGNYYAWGETETKITYYWINYKWCRCNDSGWPYDFTKYCTKSDYGTVDNKTVLEPEDDAAHVNWGGAWRMPTREEMNELKNNCTWTWTTQGGNNGYRFTGPNGESIFMPAAGCYDGGSLLNDGGTLHYAGSNSFYWSSSLYAVSPSDAYNLHFDSGGVYVVKYGYRLYGQSVRPVCPSQK